MSTKRKARRVIANRRQLANTEESPVAATEQTLSKIPVDVVAKLFTNGHIRAEQRDAAEEIANVYEAWGKCFFPKAKGIEASSPSGSFQDPMARLRPVEWRMWQERYKPWANEMGHLYLGRSRNTYLQLTFDVLIDNLTPRQLDPIYRVRNGTCLTILQTALLRYCEIAGWLRAQPYRPRILASTITQTGARHGG